MLIIILVILLNMFYIFPNDNTLLLLFTYDTSKRNIKYLHRVLDCSVTGRKILKDVGLLGTHSSFE